MKATFDFGNECVIFEKDRITVWLGEELPSLEVKPGQWKACCTHAKRLIRLAKGTEASTPHESRQRKATKPVLRLVGGE